MRSLYHRTHERRKSPKYDPVDISLKEVSIILISLIKSHIVLGCLLYVLYNVLLKVFGRRILANGWAKEAERVKKENEGDEYFERVGNALDDPLIDFLTFFIPVMNVEFVLDLIKMIVTKV